MQVFETRLVILIFLLILIALNSPTSSGIKITSTSRITKTTSKTPFTPQCPEWPLVIPRGYCIGFAGFKKLKAASAPLPVQFFNPAFRAQPASDYD